MNVRTKHHRILLTLVLRINADGCSGSAADCQQSRALTSVSYYTVRLVQIIGQVTPYPTITGTVP
jgi:hypothetical protein